MFGESGVLEARPRAANATAVTTTTLLITEAELFKQAFGMDNDRALSLVKLLCARLRSTTLRAAKNGPGGNAAVPAAEAAIELLPAHTRLTAEFAMKPLQIRFLPFQVGNRFGGETVPIASNRSFCIPARGDIELSAPHFEILRRGGAVGIRDLGSRDGTIVNGTLLNRASLNPVAALHDGDNEVVAGRAKSSFRFLVRLPAGF